MVQSASTTTKVLAEDPEFLKAFDTVISKLKDADSYHAQILKDAFATELDRGKIYAHAGGSIEWNEFELLYLYGAIYKLLRTKNTCTDYVKALDDIKDAYNYCGLFYRYVAKHRIGGVPSVR